MNTKKQLALTLCGTLLVGCLTGYGIAAASGDSDISSTKAALPQVSNAPAPSLPASAEDCGEYTELIAEACSEFIDSGYTDITYEERFKPYEQFGLTYDANKNELQYNGQTVRWFEDYYPLSEENLQAGIDFFDENGVVDVYAVRDFSRLVRSDDGSFDPSGTLVGVTEFSAEAFAARDIEAIKNPPIQVSIAGDPPSAEELEAMAREYEAFGVTYDIRNDQWYFNGEKVRLFQDVLTSNGESLTSGKFKGAIRHSWSAGGTIDIYTVRDFSIPNANGYGTLTGIEKFSQEEFDEHTQSSGEVLTEASAGSGFCTVTQD